MNISHINTQMSLFQTHANTEAALSELPDKSVGIRNNAWKSRQWCVWMFAASEGNSLSLLTAFTLGGKCSPEQKEEQMKKNKLTSTYQYFKENNPKL